MRGLKSRLDGEIEIGGPALAKSLGDLGLIDEYRLYLHPVVVGHGKPFFCRPSPAAAPCEQRANCRGCDAVNLRACLIARFAARPG